MRISSSEPTVSEGAIHAIVTATHGDPFEDNRAGCEAHLLVSAVPETNW